MASPSTQVALAVFGLLALAAVGIFILPDGAGSVERHQLPGAPGAPVTADQVQVTTSGTGAARVLVQSPVDRATLVEMSAGPSGTVVSVLGAQVLNSPTAAAPIVVQGDVLRDQVLTFVIPVPGESYSVKVDRSTSPATVTLSDGLYGDIPREVQQQVGKTLQVPLAWAGDVANPTSVRVFHPATPSFALLEYRDNGDGTSTVRYYNPANNTNETKGPLRHEFVQSSGSPVEASWSIKVTPPDGSAPTTFTVPLGAVRAQLSAAGTNPDAVLLVARDALYDTKAYKAATDGNRTWASADLNGMKWLNGNLPNRVFVDVPERQVASVPTLVLEAANLPVQQVAMTRGATANGYVRHEATVPASWLAGVTDGGVVKFSVAHRITAAKLVTQQLLDDNSGAGYRWKVDKAGPAVGPVNVQADAAQPRHLIVSWSATDAGSGVASFRVERQLAAGPWEQWILATNETTGTYTGDAGKTYNFRVAATDAVGNVGPWRSSSPFAVPGGGSGAENRAPTVQLLQPTGGESFVGVASLTIKWRASDPDGNVPVINLYWSQDGGATWDPIASPSGTQYAWDISLLPASRDYRVKVEATDGSLANQDTSARFRIDNSGLATADDIGGGGQASLPAGEDAMPGEELTEGDGSQAEQAAGAAVDPMLIVGLAVVLIGAAAGVAIWRWRTSK